MNKRRTETLELAGLLDTLYEGMLDEAAWSRALTQLSDCFGGATLALFSVIPSTNAVLRYDVTRNDPDAMRDYQENWIHRDPRHAAGLTCAVGEPQTERMLVDVRRLRRMPLHHEFMERWRVPYFMATWLVREPARGAVITLCNDTRHGEFSDAERSSMRALVPHLRRILEVKDRLQLANVVPRSLLDTTDRLSFATLFLGADLTILEASRAAADLLAARDGIHADGNRLGFVRGGDAAAFVRMLDTSTSLRGDADCHVVARRRGPPLSLLVLPIAATQSPWLGVPARWMVLVFDPLHAKLPDRHRLQLALGISAAEAALAQLIASGQSVTQAALELGITRNTARTQLKSIYSKTGTRSQSQLARLVLTGPAMLS